MTAIPLYPGIAPYTQLPTQYSVHVCSAPGKVIKHREFLADPARDCREELAAKLIKDLGDKGSIVAYSSFEKTVISKLAEDLPRLAKRLTGLRGRIVDLKAIIVQGFYHPGFRGSNSIKRTLPVLISDMTYEGMEIGDGDTTVAMFARMAKGQVKPKEAAQIRKALLAYCEQDTLAMVRLHERLLQLSS